MSRSLKGALGVLLIISGFAGTIHIGSDNAEAVNVWVFDVVEPVGFWGGDSSIEIDAGDIPHLSYYDDDTDELKYANWTGGSWNILVVDSGGAGRTNSLALDNKGYPHISYSGSLKYANWTGTSWNIVTVDSTAGIGSHNSIALDGNNYPHISYYDSNAHDLKYAKWTGSMWDVQIVDDGVGWDAGESNSIAIASNGYPQISYKYEDATDWYLRRASWNGFSWNIETVCLVGPANFLDPMYNSLALDGNNYAHISYHDNNYNLKYANWTGSSWAFDTIDTDVDVGRYNSLALDGDDLPSISYYDSNNGDLKFANWTGSGWNVEVVDSTGDVGEESSIALDSNGFAHISYYDSSNWRLKYVKSIPNNSPVSNVDPLSTFSTTQTFPVGATASDPDLGNTITQVELHYRKDSGPWTLYGTDTASPFTWTFDTSTTGGDGIYQFYSRAQDNYGAWEAPDQLPPLSGNNDTWTIVDTTRPTSSVNVLPAFETTSTFTVDAVASDLNGIAQVELYYKRDLGSWTLYNPDTTPPFSWSFDTSTTGGDGIYQFYSKSQDNAGLWEDPSQLPPSSGNNDTWTIVDTTKPTSSIDPLPTYETMIFLVNATVSDLNGIAQTELYYKNETGAWTLGGTDTSPPFSWAVDSSAMGGDGIFQFYSRAQDNGGHWEDPSELPPLSGNNDTWTIVDTVNPTSSLNALPTYEATTVFQVDATAFDSNGLGQVELYYKRDTGSWILYGADTTSPYSWSFDTTTTGGDGTYQFYSRAEDNAGRWELPSQLPPQSGNNDSWTIVDTNSPAITNLQPPDASKTNDSTPTIGADYSDTSGIDTSSVVLELDGLDVASSATVTSSGVLFTPSAGLSDGLHVIYLKVNDTLGNPATRTWSFKIDATPPNIYDVLINGEVSKSYPLSAIPVLTLTATVDDSATGNSNISGANYTTGSGNWPSSQPMEAADGTWNDDSSEFLIANIPQPQAPGVFTYCAYAWDDGLNYNISSVACATLAILDDLPPEVDNPRINGQSSISISPGSSLVLTASVSDVATGGSDIGGANYTVGPGNWLGTSMSASLPPFDSPTEDVTLLIDTTNWLPGTYYLYIYAWDIEMNGNSTSTAYVTLTILDITPPNADAGDDLQVAQGETVCFNGSQSSDDSGAILNFTWTFTYDGSEITLHGGSPTFLFEKVGSYKVTLSVKDPSNNAASDTMWVNVTGVDSDNDGLTDYDETNIYNTEPNNPDTDGDGVNDGDEVAKGTNPRVAEPSDKDFLSEYWWLILLMVIIIIVLIAAGLLARRRKKKPEEIASDTD